jgi:hypothetical protein
MKTKLLRKVQQHILEEPRRLNMRTFRTEVTGFYETDPPCGTTACIAGWAGLLNDPPSRHMNWQEGREVLGLSRPQSERLFTPPEFGPATHCWPKEFRRRYNLARSPAGRAKVAAERIEHFIKTKGRE